MFRGSVTPPPSKRFKYFTLGVQPTSYFEGSIGAVSNVFDMISSSSIGEGSVTAAPNLFQLSIKLIISTRKQSTTFVPPDEKSAEIEAKVHLQEDRSPIIIEGYSKAELVAFYIQSYSDETIATWVDFAYKKMHRFEESKPSEEQ